MLNYPAHEGLPIWFGDFGGNEFCDEFMSEQFDTASIETILASDDFEKGFRDTLQMLLPFKLKLRPLSLPGGAQALLAPAFGKYYSIAGQLALAQIMSKRHILLGAEHPALALATARVCAELGLSLDIIVSCELSRDPALICELQRLGCSVDTRTCTEYFDLPYVHALCASHRLKDRLLLTVTANYPEYPYPALSGRLAGVYGADLKELCGAEPDCVVVPIQDGTEAVALLGAYMGTGVRLVTAEHTVAQEYHTGESLMTRSADNIENNTLICPQLADWWRTAKVMRLGCDRLRLVETQELEAAGLPFQTARAVALARERMDCRTILTVEA